jgi:hypothetical protein
MEKLLSAISQDPRHAVFILSILLAGYLLKIFLDRLRQDFNRFENKMAKWEISMAEHMTNTQMGLATHSADMGKATKAINGDMLRIKDNLFELKQGLLDKIQSVRDFTNNLEQEFRAVAINMKATTDRFEDRFGGTVELKQELDDAYTRITVLESDVKLLRERGDKHTEWFEKVARSLDKHQTALKK